MRSLPGPRDFAVRLRVGFCVLVRLFFGAGGGGGYCGPNAPIAVCAFRFEAKRKSPRRWSTTPIATSSRASSQKNLIPKRPPTRTSASTLADLFRRKKSPKVAESESSRSLNKPAEYDAESESRGASSSSSTLQKQTRRKVEESRAAREMRTSSPSPSSGDSDAPAAQTSDDGAGSGLHLPQTDADERRVDHFYHDSWS